MPCPICNAGVPPAVFLSGGLGMIAAKREPEGEAVEYQLSWKTLPGLRGLSCSEFRASPTDAPNNERGVAFACATEAERDALVRRLEEYFAPQRFSNAAAAFETVKACALEWTTKDL
jgi:hypothetical protein